MLQKGSKWKSYKCCKIHYLKLHCKQCSNEFHILAMGGGMVALTTLAVTAWNLSKTLSRRLAMVILK